MIYRGLKNNRSVIVKNRRPKFWLKVFRPLTKADNELGESEN